MRTEIVTCDNCGKQFDPKTGVGELKVSFTDPSNPIRFKNDFDKECVMPNVLKIRKEELCPKCTKILMEDITYSLRITMPDEISKLNPNQKAEVTRMIKLFHTWDRPLRSLFFKAINK